MTALLVLAVAASAPALANPKYAGIVVDAKTGETLYANDADQKRYPASLTKMMTLYLVFEALDAGKITKKSRIPVSRNAAAESPSKLYLRPGETITVEQAILALVTKSANDVATAVGEFLGGGSEATFARLMTAKAQALGMTNTTFRNAHGLPNTAQVTTARDMARLGIALREHFPHHYHYFSTRAFKYGKATYGNHNKLLGRVEGVDGIKTGYTRASGFNLVTSVERDGRSIVAVVMGGRTGASRDAQMRELIAKYLPKASRGPDRDLVPQTAPAPVLVAGFDLPKVGPVPQFRSIADLRVAMAYATAAAPVPDARPVEGRAALAAVLKAAPRPSEPVLTAMVETEPTGAIIAQGDIDPVTTSSLPSGWVIQVGAMPDLAAANAFLAKAKEQAGKVLASAEPFTMPYSADGQQLYRARFAGFSGKDAAWAACDALKQKGFGCWAVLQ